MKTATQGELTVRYYIGDNNAKILNRLADEIEGACGPQGYVLPGTTRFISRSAPYLDRNENGGVTRVIVRYESDIVQLQRGDDIEVRITNVNRLGAMTEYNVDGHTVANILLPADLQEEGVPEHLFHRDHVVCIKILDLRFGVGWDKITAVGRVVYDSNSTENGGVSSMMQNPRSTAPVGAEDGSEW